MNRTAQSIRGMHDILPAEMPLWHRLEQVVADVLGQYGFQEIRMPVLEKTEVFTRAIGQATDVVEKEMYTFDDRNGESLSLRPEGTAGLVRAALQNGLLYGAPERLWYRGPMFRHERPQKGRTRQFHQVGAEVFGAEGPDVDAELLAMGERIWRQLGLGNIRLELNSLGNAEERARYREALTTFMGQHRDQLDSASAERLERNPLRILDSKDESVQALLQEAPVLTDFLGDESRRFFDGLLDYLARLGIGYTLNPRLVRGLDYYCHAVFEWVTDDLGAQGTVCAGGRYDGLVELQGGKPWPATGFAMGMERLVALMEQAGGTESETPHGYLVLAGEAAKREGMALAEQLRSRVPGLRLVCNAGQGSFKSQFKRADRSGAPLALILGDDEVEAREVSVKFLREDRPQSTLDWDDVDDWLESWLDED
ncbi:MAG: histidine--tRNA ligase [Xanthomonadales bacterium]|jgi:histidyl-tRNA synthetase|nr:histidine--tRNA ligase [Xanthomonadales bacterium]